MLSDAKLWLTDNEPVISAIVGIITLAAAAWGVLRIRYQDASLADQFADDGELEAAAGVDPRATGERSLRAARRRLFDLGITGKSQIEEVVASRTINVTVVVLLAVNLVWILAGLFAEQRVYFTLVNGAVFLVGLIILVLQAGGNSGVARWLLLLLLYSYWTIVLLSVGNMWGVEHFIMVLCLLPLLLFKRYERWQQISAVLLLLGFFVLQYLLGRVYGSGLLQLDESFLRIGYLVNIPLLSVVVLAVFTYYSSFSMQSFHTLEDQKDRADELAKSVFPEDVLLKVRENDSVVAAYREEASVLFLTVQGFEDLYQRMTARQLVEMMSRIFLAFDALLEKHGIEKINMLGTSYVAASGVFNDAVVDHAAVARFALDATAELERYSAQSGHNFNLRAGLSVGQVVGGVIGDARPTFDIWGETVELAVSMQGAAVNNTVIVSEQCYWRLKDQFEFAAMTHLEKSYILLRESPDATTPDATAPDATTPRTGTGQGTAQ